MIHTWGFQVRPMLGYHYGNITVVGAERMLKNEPNGVLLVKDSSDSGNRTDCTQSLLRFSRGLKPLFAPLNLPWEQVLSRLMEWLLTGEGLLAQLSRKRWKQKLVASHQRNQGSLEVACISSCVRQICSAHKYKISKEIGSKKLVTSSPTYI